jgi:hypothetical protein
MIDEFPGITYIKVFSHYDPLQIVEMCSAFINEADANRLPDMVNVKSAYNNTGLQVHTAVIQYHLEEVVATKSFEAEVFSTPDEAEAYLLDLANCGSTLLGSYFSVVPVLDSQGGQSFIAFAYRLFFIS